MARDKMELIRLATELFNRRDEERWLEPFHADVEFRPPRYWMDGIVYRGHAGLLEWIRGLSDTWSHMEFVGVTEVASTETEVVVEAELEGMGVSSDVPIRQRVWVRYEFSGDLVTATTSYPNKEAALEEMD